MAASYPGSVVSFTTKVDNVDFVLASHPNSLQDEVIAIETYLGVSPQYSGTMTSSGFIGTANYNHGSLAARVTNVERGLYANINTNYVSKTGGDTITVASSSSKGLVIKAASGQSANLQEWQKNDGTVGSYIDPDGNFVASNISNDLNNLYVSAVVFG